MFREAQTSKTHVTPFKRFAGEIRHDKILVTDLSRRSDGRSRFYISKSDPDHEVW